MQKNRIKAKIRRIPAVKTPVLRVAVKYCDHYQGLPKPAYQTAGAAGFDLMAANEDDIVIAAGGTGLVPSGLCLMIPAGFEGQVRPRSGLALKHGVTVLNSPGTIDSDYRGEIKIILINHGREDFIISRGMRMAQMVIGAVVRMELAERAEIEETERNDGGFGHTGR